jgi:DNA-binding response OmpR family regulator
MPRKILVVDDNIDSVTILRSILEKQNFSVQAALSGAEALQKLEEDVPDVVLLDVMMPEMSGLEVLQAIRDNNATATLPVIMVTAKIQDDDVLAGYQYGADYYITKPCTSKQLLYGISLVLDKNAEARKSDKDEIV